MSSPDDTAYLYRYEAKGIQAFILRTNRLREIKGGSLLIERLSDLLWAACAAMPEAQQPTILSVAAGGANLHFESAGAVRRFASTWPMLVDHHVPGLQVIQAWVLEGEPEAWKKLQRNLRLQRNHLNAALPEAGPHTFRDQRTGLPAASKGYPPGATGPNRTPERQDRGTARKRAMLVKDIGGTDGLDDARDRIGARLDKDQTWAFELEAHIPGSRIALVHIDGNDLGKRIKALQDQGGDLGGRIGRFSRALSDVTEAAAKKGYERACEAWEASGGGERFPGRPVVLGGDDITFILRADLAMPFCREYLKAFEALSRDNAEALGGPLTASGGVAFVHISYPFGRAHDLAESLCAFAKKQLRGAADGEATPSALAWYHVTTSMVEDYEGLLQTELARGDLEGALTAGPYTLHPRPDTLTLAHITALADALTGAPRGPVRETLALLGEDLGQAQERWRRLAEVSLTHEDTQRRERWKTLQEALDGMKCSELVRTVRGAPDDRQNATPLLDAWNLLRQRRGRSADDARGGERT